MKAVIVKAFGGAEEMEYTDVEIPKISSRQVLIRAEKSSVNFADIKARRGNKGKGTLPFIPGLDLAGTIVEVGTEVQHFKKGQRVIAFPAGGSYCEYAAADEQLTFLLPDNIDFETAAACPTVAFLAYKLLANIARMERGETVLVHSAAGGVGSTAIQFAKALGAGMVIGTVGNRAKAQTALDAGADYVLSYEQNDRFAEQVKEWTDGKGADIILDSLAGTITEKSLDCLALYGRLVQFGNSSGKSGNFTTNDVHSSCRSVLGFSLGTTRKERPHVLQETAKQVFRYLETGQVKMEIGKIFDLKDAADAHRWVESRQSTGKVLLQIAEL
ncbi:quinone oxidoreductase family protein [Heyndrickxia acidicola]|uniref:Zinc-binding dehydrogenase n=1 Tax=Heyndrickxia acidicola TaxID=209389 RepID=A0ABU6MNR4_9BACI|nr:zinc-binding dehydrogenase [Heyndrickxia acidicola]MED1204675.1 zinc-binding dehydrogenase [Heyndrickxia acidicola]